MHTANGFSRSSRKRYHAEEIGISSSAETDPAKHGVGNGGIACLKGKNGFGGIVHNPVSA